MLPCVRLLCRWSPCSRSCGVGVSRAERYCDSPKPKFGGRYCVGERVRYKSCIMKPCPRGTLSKDFRTQQCQAYNGKNFGLPDLPEDVKWLPKYAGSELYMRTYWCQFNIITIYIAMLIAYLE